MDEPNQGLGNLAGTSKRLARRLLTVAENRFELLTVEMQEERERLVHAFLLALGIAAFALLSGIAFTALIVILLWPYSPVAVLAGLTVVYGAAGAGLCRKLSRSLRDWTMLSASLEQLRKDRSGLERLLS
jgi:uncharacterized membrane protein YqjE